MSAFSPTTLALLELMAQAPRGPRRDGTFALWLMVRLLEDLAVTAPPVDRTFRRRVALLEKRLSSLVLSPPLRRGLTGVLATLKEAARPEPAPMLSLLAAPAREAIGPETGDLLLRASRTLR